MQQVTQLNRRRAVFAALCAGGCWGMSFLAPRALGGTPSELIVLFRFLFFGISSVVALVWRRRRIPKISFRVFVSAIGLSLAGYSLYYFLLAVGVRGVGVTFATAVIGLLPLTILLVSTSFRNWGRVFVPVGLIVTGGVLLQWELFGSAYAELLSRSALEKSIGLAAAILALALWTAYAVLNGRFLRRNPEWAPLEWSGLLGIASAFTAAVLFFAVDGGKAGADFHRAFADGRVLFWTGFMGIAGGWFAYGLWNYASRILPPSLLGMLLVFESIFGLLFGFLYDGRMPTLREAMAVVCLIGGSLSGIVILGKLRPTDKSCSARSGAA